MQTLDNGTRQVVDALFQRVRHHLLSQYVRCVDVNDRVRWRQVRDGAVLYCAIGCLIPEDLYGERLEAVKTVDGLFTRLPNLENRLGIRPTAKEASLRFLEQLQAIHDRTGPSHWEDLLQGLASQYKLR